ncbi:nitronate monooxygenase [Cryobacterium sp. TMT1-21]|uniref:Probable nitronate monooxygenase n=1 Tax=Cryobacterium shii TaxID=1259235 RepID=A0AAQ2HGJ0_9MICO|nr:MULTISPECIES: nitronate monooxygenase [Cryobacterium]TFC51653.1 nitronate monooxygenase [Cryobacterium shii]TFC83648.1 nitronate monooxygenase [Cryobacterium sp. TmT2-59]TFD13621.1 nitronate monooxygenase [Cryobacterium sp. TMT4-10]TFD16017.1 nitronate monooxygenase [Cryobacterium sp. TMT1-21]TFD27106.1 nitronate monooxygenase [Cryobacterium sp. TMT2-23]
MFAWSDLRIPIIAAPMAGGASTPELVVSVGEAGGLGFLAAGYKTPDATAQQIIEVRQRTHRPFGVNVFVPGPPLTDQTGVESFRDELAGTARAYGVELPPIRVADDDWFPEKLALLAELRVPVVSFTFGLPPIEWVRELGAAGSYLIATVTSVQEAALAGERGIDALCVQGTEAGGHRGTFTPVEEPGTVPLAELVSAVREVSRLPIVAAGGIHSGAQIAALRESGAVAVQLGTGFLRTDESGAHPSHQAAFADPRFSRTVITRAFSGRPARGLLNAFITEHDAAAPRAYPQVHHLTKGLRAAAGRRGDPDGLALWAGTGYRSAKTGPASDVLMGLWEETRLAPGAETERDV